MGRSRSLGMIDRSKDIGCNNVASNAVIEYISSDRDQILLATAEMDENDHQKAFLSYSEWDLGLTGAKVIQWCNRRRYWVVVQVLCDSYYNGF